MVISIVQILIFVAYVMFIITKFGVLDSISESWYKLRSLGGVWYSLFTWFCWGLGFLMLFQTNGSTPLFFLSGTGLMFVGAATMFKLKDDLQPYIHFIGAAIGILGALVGLVIERGEWDPSLIFVIALTIFNFTIKVHRTWWIEIVAFLCIGL